MLRATDKQSEIGYKVRKVNVNEHLRENVDICSISLMKILKILKNLFTEMCVIFDHEYRFSCLS